MSPHLLLGQSSLNELAVGAVRLVDEPAVARGAVSDHLRHL